jgi:fatty-acyl-CoA synthase
MRALEERHGVTILHAWGMTETSAVSTVARPPATASEDEAWSYRMTQGQFAPQVQHRLVDDAGEVVPHDGESLGELQVRGPWITSSYYSPKPAPVDDDHFDDGWLRTGDIGKVTPDGFLTLVDRAKDVIKSGGEWISSVEMENDVMAHPDVAEAAVFGVPDETWGERPCVAVALREGALADVEALRAHLSTGWARWQLPELWAVVPLVPKTSVGKFDKKTLRQLFADGALSLVEAPTGPRVPTEPERNHA